MAFASWFAVYFIVWWITLFAVLPFSLRTQDEDENADYHLGTTGSAPSGPHMGRALLRTTIAALVITIGYYAVTSYFEVSLDDLPIIIPGMRESL